jgi:hypothetical protein
VVARERIELPLAAKILLGIALVVCFAPFLGYLLLGLVFFPMWVVMLVGAAAQGDGDAILIFGLLLLIIGGVFGVIALHNVLSRLYGLEVKRYDSRFVLAGLFAGMLSVLGGGAYLGFGWFALSAAVLTIILIVLDHQFLFSDLKPGI